MPPASDDRVLRAPRFALSAPLCFGEPGREWRTATVANISRSGLLIDLVTGPPPAAKQLEFILRLPTSLPTAALVACQGRIVRTTPGAEGGHRIGVAITRYKLERQELADRRAPAVHPASRKAPTTSCPPSSEDLPQTARAWLTRYDTS